MEKTRQREGKPLFSDLVDFRKLKSRGNCIGYRLQKEIPECPDGGRINGDLGANSRSVKSQVSCFGRIYCKGQIEDELHINIEAEDLGRCLRRGVMT